MEFLVKGIETSTVAASMGLRVEDATQSLGTGAVQRILVPPYDPQRLVELFEHSSALNPAVTAIVANVHECGFRFEPTIDFSNANSTKTLRVAMMRERMEQYRRAGKPYRRDDLLPTDEEVEERREEIELEIDLERAKLDAFFSSCCPFSTFGALRSLLCRDELITGNAYVEVIRDNEGEVCQFHLLKSAGMRLGFWTRSDGTAQVDEVEIEYPRRTSAISTETVMIRRPMRIFVQVGFGNTSFTYFKEFGDPRVISAKTGKVYKEGERMSSDDSPAHELIWFAAPSQRIDTPYGIPVWAGAMPLVTGAMYSQLVNESHFNHKGIPQAFLFVSGADQAAVEALRENLRIQLQEIQDLNKYHALIVVAATSQSDNPDADVTFKIEPMRQAVKDDALFQKYDAQCHKHIWMQFRIPPMLLGSAEDLNRATSDNVIRFAESQVFGPMRQRFDDVINLLLTLGLGIRYLRFVSNSPVQRNPKDVADMSKIAADVGAMSINHHLALASEQFNTPLNRVDQWWADIPMMIVRGMITNHVVPDARPAGTSAQVPATLAPTQPANALQEAPPVQESTSGTGETEAYVRELNERIQALREQMAGGRLEKATPILTSKGMALVLPYADAYAHAVNP